jgi:hypothetical protein
MLYIHFIRKKYPVSEIDGYGQGWSCAENESITNINFDVMHENSYISLVLLVIAFVFLLRRLMKYRQAISKVKFPAVEGVILSASVHEDIREYDNDDGSRTSSVRYIPKIKYAYNLSGKRYENDRNSLLKADEFFRAEDARSFTGQFPEGKIVKVYYDPASPADSFLDNSLDVSMIDAKTWFAIGTLLVLALVLHFVD